MPDKNIIRKLESEIVRLREINAKLVKKSEHYWDELTKEMMENVELMKELGRDKYPNKTLFIDKIKKGEEDEE